MNILQQDKELAREVVYTAFPNTYATVLGIQGQVVNTLITGYNERIVKFQKFLTEKKLT